MTVVEANDKEAALEIARSKPTPEWDEEMWSDQELTNDEAEDI